MKNNLFNIVSNKGFVESAKNFKMDTLMGDVKIQETETHLYISNFPGAFGDTQNKNNRVYDWDSLVYAVDQFNSVKDENPYFCYMFDGHKDDDSYENIVGRIVKLHYDTVRKCVLFDMKINKGCRSQKTIRNIMEDGDPLGASMRILSPNCINVSKDDLKEINPSIVFLDDDNASIAYLMSKDNEIEYITGDAFIWRFDITQFPSFNSSFVAKPFKFQPEMNKSESVSFRIPHASSVKLADYKEASTLFQTSVKCVTNACKFRHTIKDFVDLISMDESIKVIKDSPELYNSMLNFSYMNLGEFEFDKIVDKDYLSDSLAEAKIDREELLKWEDIMEKIVGSSNIISYLLKENEFKAQRTIQLLNQSLNAVVDEDNIFFQIITINYVHFVLLATLVLSGKAGINIAKKEITRDKLESSLANGDKIVIDLIKKIDKPNVTIYDYINHIFMYIYQYVDQYASMTAPLTIINESMKIFRPVKEQTVFSTKFLK